MNKYLLRIEGVNLDRFVFDTRDLSTIRGAGLLLLDAAKNRAKDFLNTAGAASIADISVGASVGLFTFELSSEKTGAAIRDVVAKSFRTDLQLKHGTFVVDVEQLKDESDFSPASEKVLAQNRWRQYQSGTTAVPETTVGRPPGEKVACEFDAIRPASKSHCGSFVSPATHARREYGKSQKQNFYFAQAGLTKIELPNNFANEFEEIASPQAGFPLANKLAVFYADGNKFGETGRNLCKMPEKYQAWDTYLRVRRSNWLRSFLQQELHPNKDNGWLYAKNGQPLYRFETLLWGGDEVMFVMPAWMGWRFAQHFFAAAETWNAKEATIVKDRKEIQLTSEDTPLTHTAALIYCHYHAPIHRIKDLAKEQMAEFGKGLKGKDRNGQDVEIGRTRNQLIYQVLESFDHLGSDYEGALKRRVGLCVNNLSDLAIASNQDRKLSHSMRTIGTTINGLHRSDFPRSQLRSLVNRLIRPPDPSKPISPALRDHLGTFAKGEKADEIMTALQAMRDCCLSDAAFWLHLEELWDYARP